MYGLMTHFLSIADHSSTSVLYVIPTHPAPKFKEMAVNKQQGIKSRWSIAAPYRQCTMGSSRNYMLHLSHENTAYISSCFYLWLDGELINALCVFVL